MPYSKITVIEFWVTFGFEYSMNILSLKYQLLV